MIAPEILPLPPGSPPKQCEWTDELPGEPCGDGGNGPPATHFFESVQSDGNDLELEKEWIEHWEICEEHAKFLSNLRKNHEKGEKVGSTRPVILVKCPCDILIAKEGLWAIPDTVEDLPNWTSWFGKRVFVWFMHRAIKARLRA